MTPLRRDTRVFISAVSKELGTVRKLVKKALEDSGYHAVEQDNFPLDYRELTDKLRRQIESCDAVIHIAGHCYGAEPRQRPAAQHRQEGHAFAFHEVRHEGLQVEARMPDVAVGHRMKSVAARSASERVVCRRSSGQ